MNVDDTFSNIPELSGDLNETIYQRNTTTHRSLMQDFTSDMSICSVYASSIFPTGNNHE